MVSPVGDTVGVLPLEVAFELCCLSEAVRAETALVLALPEMHAHVSLHVALLSEDTWAVLALVGTLSSMDLVVALECMLVDGGEAAQIAPVAQHLRTTLERPVTCKWYPQNGSTCQHCHRWSNTSRGSIASF